MWKSYLSSQAKKFVKQHKIFDVVIYGSAVKGKDEPRDIDIMLIFLDRNLKERLDIVQNFKQVSKKINKLDVKSMNLKDIFDNKFLARQGVLLEGRSLINEVTLADRLGFKSYSIFSYNLKNLNHNEKTKFTYALIGRKEDGMIKKVEGEPLGKGAIIVPIENSIIFEEFLNQWNVKYNKRNALLSLL